MTTRIMTAPATAAELLTHLAHARLLGDDPLRRLGASWPADMPAADAAGRLVWAGLLTAYQSEQVLAGRGRNLRFGPYRILERLGAGGGGRVYKAEHVLMRRVVTLKIFPRQATPYDEVAIVSGLSHPNLVTALHATRLRGRLALILEYVDGVDLDNMLAQTGPLPIDLVREVLRQSTHALGHLHARNLVHRDVKPANLLLVQEGPVVKLIDLGLARPAGQDRELCGTLDYMAPERGMGESIDGRSDLYSLGCTMYHLLTGQVPYPEGNWSNKLVRHRTERPVPVSQLRPDVPPTLAAMVARLMEARQQDRYPSAAALLAELEPRAAAIPLALPVKPRKRKVSPLLWLVFVAVLVGLSAGGLIRLVVPMLTSLAGQTSVKGTITGEANEEFPDLQSAINSTPDGGTLTVRGHHILSGVVSRGKSLTIRGEAGSSIERDPNSSPWEPMLWCDRELRLVGLELDAGESTAPLVVVEGGKLTITASTLRGGGEGPLLSLRRGQALSVTRSRLSARTQGIAVEVGSSLIVSLEETTVRVREVLGAAILLWSEANADDVSLKMSRCAIDSGRVLALSRLEGRVNAETEKCQFTFHQALVSIDGCRDRNDWRRHLRWRGKDNLHTSNGPYLRFDNRPMVWDEIAWGRVSGE